MENKEIDTVGLFCPEPVFRTKIELERLQTGDTLTIKANDPAADDDITRWVTRNGHELLSKSTEGDVITFKIKKVK